MQGDLGRPCFEKKYFGFEVELHQEFHLLLLTNNSDFYYKIYLYLIYLNFF